MGVLFLVGGWKASCAKPPRAVVVNGPSGRRGVGRGCEDGKRDVVFAGVSGLVLLVLLVL